MLEGEAPDPEPELPEPMVALPRIRSFMCLIIRISPETAEGSEKVDFSTHCFFMCATHMLQQQHTGSGNGGGLQVFLGSLRPTIGLGTLLDSLDSHCWSEVHVAGCQNAHAQQVLKL